MKKIWSFLLLLLLGWSLAGCGDDAKGTLRARLEATPTLNEQLQVSTNVNKLLEVATPKVIQELHDRLDRYHPEVTISSPQIDRVFDDTTVSVKFQVKDLPIFKNSQLDAGNHLNVILDNEPARHVYDLEEPLIFENLAAGTHSLRVFAVRPWEESFKNEGAFAETTFHILTKTGDNTPDPKLPLLTYNSPSGTYGAEPIMLDFYLNNAPLHLVAKQDPDDNIEDWRIRVTVNGESFVLDNWQPVYLKGFHKGKNWVQIEYIDENGNNVPNTFNNTVRTIEYDPKKKNTLAKLVENKLPLEVAKGLVEPSYTTPTIPTSEIKTEPKTDEIEPEVTSEENSTVEEIVPTTEKIIESESKFEPAIKEEQQTAKPKNEEKIESNSIIEDEQTVPEISPVKTVEPTITPNYTPNNSSAVPPIPIESEIEPAIEEKEEIKENNKNIPSSGETTETPKSFQLPQIERPRWFDNNILDRLKSSATKDETTKTIGSESKIEVETEYTEEIPAVETDI
jgi:hypothetical protein